MAEQLRKVQQGDQIEIPARTWNLMVDAAKYVQDRQAGSGVPVEQINQQNTIVLCRNDGTLDAPQYGILGIDGPIIEPTDNLVEFKKRVALTCSNPKSEDHAGKFVITLEPIPQGQIGRAYLAGATAVQIRIDSTDHKSADVFDGSMESLLSGSSGGASILWAESGTGLKWAIVRLSAGAGSSSAPSTRHGIITDIDIQSGIDYDDHLYFGQYLDQEGGDWLTPVWRDFELQWDAAWIPAIQGRNTSIVYEDTEPAPTDANGDPTNYSYQYQATVALRWMQVSGAPDGLFAWHPQGILAPDAPEWAVEP